MSSSNYLRSYLEQAPVSLALERAIECRKLASLSWEPPLLDLGCGDGLFASIFYRSPVAVGLDISPQQLLMARRTGVYRNLVCADAGRLPFARESFATIIANSVLEHIPQLSPVLTEAHRVLKRGGQFIITVPTEDYELNFFWARLLRRLGLGGLSRQYRRFVNRVFRHCHVYSASGWKEWLEAVGFEVRRMEPYLSPAVVALNDLLYPLAAVGAVKMRLVGRWFLFPGIRRLYAGPLEGALAGLFYNEDAVGGYVLIEAAKPREQ